MSTIIAVVSAVCLNPTQGNAGGLHNDDQIATSTWGTPKIYREDHRQAVRIHVPVVGVYRCRMPEIKLGSPAEEIEVDVADSEGHVRGSR